MIFQGIKKIIFSLIISAILIVFLFQLFSSHKFVLPKEFNKIEILDPIAISKDNFITYPISGCEESKPPILDKDGVPLFEYKGVLYYNPISISLYGLKQWGMWECTGNNIYLDKFLHIADWLINNIEIFRNTRTGVKYGVWFYNFNFCLHDLCEEGNIMRAPWVGGMVQGRAIRVLTRAYNITKEKEYLDTATLAMNSFLNYSDGKVQENHWISYIDRYENNLWIEEYPSQEVKSEKDINFTLNGFIFALFGIHDYYVITKNKDAERLYKMGLKTIYENIEKYISGSSDKSYYCLRHKIKSEKYHQIHINQLYLLYEETNIKFFNEWANKFKNLSKSK